MDEGGKMKRALDIVEQLSRSTREGRNSVLDQQRHQDSMLVWIVGLASAAVVALPAMYNYVLDLKSAPRCMLGIPIGFFVLSVLFGVVVRLLLEKLMQEEGLFAAMKVFGWEALKVKHTEDEEGRIKLLKEALQILNDEGQKISAQRGKVDKISRCIARLERFPFVWFALGVLFAATFAICPPLKCTWVPW
jgi:hypothetical protein